MKKLSTKQVRHLAKLASLDISDKETVRYQAQLGETLEYVKNLQKLDTKTVEPTSHTAETKNVYFADGDKNDRGLTNAEATRLAGQKKNGYFKTKRILDK